MRRLQAAPSLRAVACLPRQALLAGDAPDARRHSCGRGLSRCAAPPLRRGRFRLRGAVIAKSAGSG